MRGAHVTRVFAKPFDMSAADIESGKRLEFLYLQRAGAGARSLCIPSVTMEWEAGGDSGEKWRDNIHPLSAVVSIVYTMPTEQSRVSCADLVAFCSSKKEKTKIRTPLRKSQRRRESHWRRLHLLGHLLPHLLPRESMVL